MEENAFTPLHITAKAMEKIREVMDSQKVGPDFGLRVGIKGGSCGVEDYLLGFDSKKENDDEYLVEGLKIFIDKRHSLHVLGMEIEWLESESKKGFVFNNPVKRK